jgi:hypothetical protein
VDRHDHNDAIGIELLTAEPGLALEAMETVAGELGLSFWPAISGPEPMLALLTRLRTDLDRG